MTQPYGGDWAHDRDFKVLPLDARRSLLFITGSHRLLEVDAATADRLVAGPGLLTGEEAEEWTALGRAGLFDDVNRRVLARSAYEDGANLAINVNLTGACNLACSYCFADGGDYGRIVGKMQSGTVDHIFEFIRRHVTASRTVRFEFFGGEPLLNFPRIQEICERSDAVGAETGIRFIHRISTNLTVLPEGAPELMRDRGFIVSVSIDGGARTHDANRPTKRGTGSFDTILANCRRVRSIGGDAVTLVARMTVVTAEPPLIENVRALWQLNLFDYFQIYPGVTASHTCNGGDGLLQLTRGAAVKPATMEATFLDQLRELMAEYPSLFSPANRFRGTLEYERLAQMVMEGKMALGFCSAGRTYFTFSPDDSIMACHRMVGELSHQAGTAARGITRDLSEWTLPVDQHPVCSACWARYACGGNCRQENFVATGQLRVLNEDTCQYQRALLGEVLQLLGRTPTEYHAADRSRLDDLFVSCGRPVVGSGRAGDSTVPRGLRHFRPLVARAERRDHHRGTHADHAENPPQHPHLSVQVPADPA